MALNFKSVNNWRLECKIMGEKKKVCFFLFNTISNGNVNFMVMIVWRKFCGAAHFRHSNVGQCAICTMCSPNVYSAVQCTYQVTVLTLIICRSHFKLVSIPFAHCMPPLFTWHTDPIFQWPWNELFFLSLFIFFFIFVICKSHLIATVLLSLPLCLVFFSAHFGTVRYGHASFSNGKIRRSLY